MFADTLITTFCYGFCVSRLVYINFMLFVVVDDVFGLVWFLRGLLVSEYSLEVE